MASTTTTIIAAFTRKYPDCDATTALEYLNKVLADLCRLLPLYRDSEDITLSANTIPPHTNLDYALDEDIARVYSAEYWASATDVKPLSHVNQTRLEQREGMWRNTAAGIPTRYFLTTNSSGARRVGLLPATSVATSGGYPIVRLYVTRVKTLTAGQSVPQGVSCDDVFVDGMAYYWASATRPSQAQELWALYQSRLKSEVNYTFNTPAFSPPTFNPGWVALGGGR